MSFNYLATNGLCSGDVMFTKQLINDREKDIIVGSMVLRKMSHDSLTQVQHGLEVLLETVLRNSTIDARKTIVKA